MIWILGSRLRCHLIRAKNYDKPYDEENREVTTAAIIIDGDKRQAVL